MERNSTTGLICLVAIISAFTIGLHQLGDIGTLSVDWGDPIAWATRSAPEIVIGAIMRHTGLMVGYYALATILLCLATARRHNKRRPRWIRFITLPAIRRIVDRSLAATLAAAIVSTPIGPALAEQPPAPIVFETSTDGIPVPHVRVASEDDLGAASTIVPDPVTVTTPPPIGLLSTETVPQPRRVVAPPVALVAPATTAAAVRHTVDKGDNLWTIAASRLSDELGSEPTTAQIGDYWRLIVAANRKTLRSGDPNLIYPGEVISLPATSEIP